MRVHGQAVGGDIMTDERTQVNFKVLVKEGPLMDVTATHHEHHVSVMIDDSLLTGGEVFVMGRMLCRLVRESYEAVDELGRVSNRVSVELGDTDVMDCHTLEEICGAGVTR